MMLLLSAHGFTLAPRLSVRTSTPARAISMLEGRPNFATSFAAATAAAVLATSSGARLAEAMPPLELDVSSPVSVPTATLIAEQTDMTASDFDWKEWSNSLGKPKPPPEPEAPPAPVDPKAAKAAAKAAEAEAKAAAKAEKAAAKEAAKAEKGGGKEGKAGGGLNKPELKTH